MGHGAQRAIYDGIDELILSLTHFVDCASRRLWIFSTAIESNVSIEVVGGEREKDSPVHH